MLMRPVFDSEFQALVSQLPPLDLHHGPWIAGGAARKLWEGKPWVGGDVDVFFSSWEQFGSWQRLLLEKFPDEQVEDELVESHSLIPSGFTISLCSATPKRKAPIYVAHQSDNAVTYVIRSQEAKPNVTLQLIKRRFGSTIQQVWDTFDFHNCDFATDGVALLASEEAAWGSSSGELLLKDPTNTSNLALRTLKYHLHGFDASKELLLSTVKQLTNGEYTWDNDY
jgi:hypothetical protein